MRRTFHAFLFALCVLAFHVFGVAQDTLRTEKTGIAFPSFAIPLQGGLNISDVQSAYRDPLKPLYVRPSFAGTDQLMSGRAGVGSLAWMLIFVNKELAEIRLRGQADAFDNPNILAVEKQLSSLPRADSVYTRKMGSGGKSLETWTVNGILYKKIIEPADTSGQDTTRMLHDYRINFRELPPAPKLVAETADSTGEAIPDPASFVPFDIAPQPLPEASPQPDYPEKAKAFGAEGRVVVKVYVDKHGVVRKWVIAHADPAGMGFEEAVKAVIPLWRFNPAMQKGKPVGVWVAIPFNFSHRQ